MTDYRNDATQSERRAQAINTYLAHAEATIDIAAGGRFAKAEQRPTPGVPIYPTLPASSPWASDPVPPEEPLGFDVNAVPDLGFECRTDDLGEPPAPVSVAPTDAVETGSPIPSTLRRRA